MTDLITRDPNDTGEIPGDSTRNLKPEIRQALLHVSPNLRSADATEVILVREDPLFAQLRGVLYDSPPVASLTGEILALDDRPYPPVPPPAPPAPKWAQPASHHALVRRRLATPKPGRGRHRAAAPKWTGRLIWSGSVLFVLASVVVAVLAVIR